MIIVLCNDTKRPYCFPAAVTSCPSYACPADDCKAKGEQGTCVVGVKDGEPTCLASFPHAAVVSGCDCTENPCVHMDADHPGMQPLIDRLLDWHEPPGEKIARAKAEVRRVVLGDGTPVQEQTLMRAGSSGGDAFGKLLTYQPQLAEWLPLTARAQADKKAPGD